MRILGAAAVMLASVSAGFFAVTQKRRRLRCLRDLCESLTLIAGELEGKRAPLPELIQTACLFSAGEPRGFFKHLREALPQLGVRFFFQLWEETARQHLPSGFPPNGRRKNGKPALHPFARVAFDDQPKQRFGV